MERFNLRFKSLVINLVLFVLVLWATNASALSPLNENKANMLYDSSKTYYSNWEYDNAIHCLDGILELKTQSKEDSNPEYYKVYNMYGVIYKAMGLLDKADEYYQKAVSFPLSPEAKARIVMNLGNLYLLKGDFNSAIAYYNKVQSLVTPLNHLRLLANSYYNIGVAYDNTSQDEQALKYFLLNIETREKAGLPEDGETMLSCASSYYKNGKNDTADIYFRKAIACYRRTVGGNHYPTALAYNNYARFLVERNDYGRALEYYNKCLGILDKTVGEKHIYKSYCFQNLGDLYDRLRDYGKALAYYQKALIAKVYGFNNTSIYSNPTNSSIADIKILYLLKSKAFTLEKLSQEKDEEKNLLAAFNTLELNAGLIEQLRNGYLYEASKLKLTENEDNTYKALVRVSAKLYEKTGEQKYAEAAFAYSEKGKYGVLREFYNEESQMKAASIPDNLYERQKTIRERLNGLRFQIEDENSLPKPGEEKLKSLQEQLFEETQNYESLLAKLEKDYSLCRKDNNDVVDIEIFKSKLYAEQVALEYTVSDSTLYTFFVSKDTFGLYKSALDSNFFSSLDFYKEFLSNEGYLSYDSFRISAYLLYKTLLQPFEKEIKNKSLLIIPDGEFSLISFDALVDQPYKKVEFHNYAFEPYIIRKYPIGYAFSASLYSEALKKWQPESKRTLAIATDYLFPDGSKANTPFLKKHLRRLTLFGGRFFDGEMATETNFKKAASEYGIIHIYAHGHDNLEDPIGARIMLEKDSLNDGNLYASEVGDLQLNSSLVVLASCYSGSGKIAEGEGIMSIGRSFMGAGASSIVMSLWYTYLEVATEQLGTMQKYLLLGNRKDKAMQLAKLKYLKNADEISGHPKEWASLIIVGNQEALYPWLLKKSALIFLFVFSIALICFIIKRRRRKKRA